MDARTDIEARLESAAALLAPSRRSTDAAVHLFGAEIFKKTPCVVDSKPGGRFVAKDIREVATIPLLMKTLLDNGHLRENCLIATGRTITENLKSVTSHPKPEAAIGGPIAVHGDGGVVDAEIGSLNVKLTDAGLAERKTSWKPGATNHTSGALWKDAAVDGAVTHPGVCTRNSVMRTSKRIIFALLLGAPLAAPAFGFDGAPVNADTAIPVVAAQPGAASALKKAIPPAAAAPTLNSLQYAAEGGHPIAQWKLGRMYADGDGVAQDDLRAFEYFSRIANQHAEDNPSAPQAGVVANAFVALGRYYLKGIPNSKVKSDPDRAREMFSYAASYFGNADAQYDLARLYLKGSGSSRDDFRYGARWLGLAAQKGQHQAQAMLGQMLFNGDQLPPQRARGLMWLTLASENARSDETWIKESYSKALAKASEDDRAMALQMLENWVQRRKD